MNSVRRYLLCMAAASVLYGLLSVLLGSDRMKRTLRFSGTLVLLLCVMAPVLRIDPAQIAKAFSSAVITSEQARTGVDLKGQDIQTAIITRRCREYISDKILELGMMVEFSLTMNDEQGISYPYQIEIRGSADDYKKDRLSAFLSAELGIPQDRQVWIND